MDQEQYFSFAEAPTIKIKTLLCVLVGLDYNGAQFRHGHAQPHEPVSDDVQGSPP
jgi:hypothetical protein